MKEFLKTRWPLLLVLVVFVILKYPHLFYAYYWDESWPYAVAIKQMYQHGISLSPTALDGELTRGHPLFFHAAGATWMKIFGSSHLSMHSFALFISLSFLVAIYEIGLRLFSQRAAILSLLLVASQEVFFVQSSFVLFEMLVAFLCFISIYFYARDRYILTALCLSALFYTKESGLIAGFVIGIAALVDLFNKRIEWKVRLLRIASVAVPVVLIGIFFLWQKHVRGWYILPLYNNLIERDWGHFWYNFRLNCLRSNFHENYKYYVFLLLLAVGVVAAIKSKNLRYLALFLPGAVIYVCVDNERTARVLSSQPLFIFLTLSLIYCLYVFSKMKIYRSLIARRFIILITAFIFCFFCFSASNFFTYRYLLPTITATLFFVGVMLDVFIERSYRFIFYPVVACILAISAYAFYKNDHYGDSDMGAYDGLTVQQNVVEYLEQKNYYDKIIGSGSFLENEHMLDPAAGFLHTDRPFKTRWEIDEQTQIVVFDNLEPDGRYDNIKKSPAFVLDKRFEKGKVWAEIYKRTY